MLLNLLKEIAASMRPRAKTRQADGGVPSPAAAPGPEAQCRHRVEAMPYFSDAHNELGVVLEGQLRVPEAEASFRTALDLNSENIAALYNLANVCAQTARPREAEALYREAIRLLPEFVEAHDNLGVVLMNSRRFAEAEAAFRRALGLKPGFAPARAHLDALATASRRTVPGQDAAGSAELAALADRGMLLADTGHLDESAAAYRRALELEPRSERTWFNLAIVLARARRLVEAADAYRRALDIEPDYPDARLNLRFVANEIERLSRAEGAWRRVLAAAAGDGRAQYNLGVTLLELGRPAEAAEALGGVLAQDPDNSRAHRNLGVALLAQGQAGQAIQSLRRAIEIEPGLASTMAELAKAYLAAGDVEQAAHWCGKALAVEPAQRDANQCMAWLLRRTGRGGEAAPYAERGSARPPVYVEYAARPVRTVLVLWAGTLGNVPTVGSLFPITVNTRVNWVFESAHTDIGQDLPDYDLVFNATGDRDVAKDAADPIRRFAQTCRRPVLNDPAKVARTARHELPALLDGIDDIVVPPVFRFARSDEWDADLAARLPLLVRPVESHGGRELTLVRTAEELERERQSRAGAVYVCPFVDFRSADSWFRKFRIVYIDREPMPVHLAISPHWMVHYATADMEAHEWKLAEERRFMSDPAAFLGPQAMRAIRAIGRRLDLDYTGIDFSLLAGSRILVFEANPTMLVHYEAIDGPVASRNAHIAAIQRNFESLLQRIDSAA